MDTSKTTIDTTRWVTTHDNGAVEPLGKVKTLVAKIEDQWNATLTTRPQVGAMDSSAMKFVISRMIEAALNEWRGKAQDKYDRLAQLGMVYEANDMRIVFAFAALGYLSDTCSADWLNSHIAAAVNTAFDVKEKKLGSK